MPHQIFYRHIPDLAATRAAYRLVKSKMQTSGVPGGGPRGSMDQSVCGSCRDLAAVANCAAFTAYSISFSLSTLLGCRILAQEITRLMIMIHKDAC